MLLKPKSRENRQSQRLRALRSGRIFYEGDLVTVECVVRDLSEGGARLKCKSWFNSPKYIKLVLGDGELAEEPIECEVVWQDYLQMGVRFLEQRKKRTSLHS